MLDNMSQREKILLITAVILVILAVYYFLFYKPLTQEIKVLEQQKKLKEKKLESDRKIVSKLPSLKKKYNDLLARQKRNKAYYVEKSIIDLLIDMREITEENNIDLIRFQPVENEKQIKMNVSLKGDYFQFCDLFLDFADWNNWFEFADLRLKGQGEIINVSMSIIYHKKIEEGDKE